jgi:hypothetical protein
MPAGILFKSAPQLSFSGIAAFEKKKKPKKTQTKPKKNPQKNKPQKTKKKKKQPKKKKKQKKKKKTRAVTQKSNCIKQSKLCSTARNIKRTIIIGSVNGRSITPI